MKHACYKETNKDYENLLNPGYIGKMRLRNRSVMPAMGTIMTNADQTISENFLEYHFARAAGEIAMNVIEITSVEERGKGQQCCPGIWHDKFIPGLGRLAGGIHERGGRCCIQLHHAGRGTGTYITGERPVAPSELKAAGMNEVPRALEHHEVIQIIDAFGDGAKRAQKAGCDCVEIHGGHGYLVFSFLSPLSNQRTDEFGGSLENRARFMLEIIRNIKQKCGKDYPVIPRFSISEERPGGWTKSDMLRVAKWAEEAGADAIHSTTGSFYDLGGVYKVISPMYIPHGFLLNDIRDLKKAVNIPVIAVGGITPDLAETALNEGGADFVSFGRQSLADPDFMKKLRTHKAGDIRYCIRCNSCMMQIEVNQQLRCAVNAALGREKESEIRPADEKKNILIAGAGPAGMEAALIAGQRGHNVKLYEKSGELGGGQLRLALNIKGKDDIENTIAYHKNTIAKYDNIKVILNTKVDRKLIDAEEPDAVIIATGGKPISLKVPGSDKKQVVSVFDLLSGKASAGNSVVVIGGGLIGAEAAQSLAEKGKKVTIVEMESRIARTMDPATLFWVIEKLGEKNAEILTNATVKEITDSGVVVVDKDGKKTNIAADTVVVAVGTTPDTDLENELEGIKTDVYIIGDALAAQKIMHAISDGFHLARAL
ncbi:MAG: NAD(P)/FAD-dependent oxidoreductase [Treponema sp.]|jgi:2,4-dienoyl-CoA reductase-like NADH-dependent reductase (Old Yellow Enzyme family)/thioredoxin reductase|nr:NAD(P)/FAD-dependent oxidoreductase [Treponema sp.]